MRIAILFWGITRSLKHTLDSFNENIVKMFIKNNINYDIYIHSYKMNRKLCNSRSKEYNVEYDNEEYKLLNPQYIEIEDEDEVKTRINFEQYKTHYDCYNTDYKNIDNFIYAVYSKQKVSQLVEKSGKEYDYIIYLRPDVEYVTNFDLEFLNHVNKQTIGVPNFHVYFDTINDRFFLMTFDNLSLFGNLFDHLLEYSKERVIHPEYFYYHILKNIYNLDLIYIPFGFNRVRADGKKENDYIPHPFGWQDKYTLAKSNVQYKICFHDIFKRFKNSPLVWITFINKAYIIYLENFLKSMEINKCEFLIIVYCSDCETLGYLKKFKNCFGVSLSDLGLEPVDENLAVYGSLEYTKIVYMKLDLTRLTLQHTRSLGVKAVGYIDCDIVLFKDPTPIFLEAMEIYKDYPIFSQCNELKCWNLQNCYAINSGVIVYRNIPQNIELISYDEETMKRFRATQAFLMDKIKKLKIKRITFDTDILLNGNFPGIQEQIPICIPDSACLLHFNWIKDEHFKKIELMKSQNMWYM